MLKRKVLSIILAAGRGSRMKGYRKNKTTISLLSGYDYPIILEILKNTPPGNKIVVVNYKKEDVICATRHLSSIIYCEQAELNGTGGAILAVHEILKTTSEEYIIITMGDVPLVTRKTYLGLIRGLQENELVVLAFKARKKRQYGVLDIEGDKVKRIIEWNTWKEFSKEEQKRYNICNSGIYAVNKKALLRYIPVLNSRPHLVIKERNGIPTHIKEYFLTDLIEYMYEDKLNVTYKLTNEAEVMGVDDPNSLNRAKNIFISKRN